MLNELGIKYHTDKVGHGYLPVYEMYFNGIRNNCLNILEIGVHLGASLRMWKEYFVNSQIHGIDNVPQKKELEEHRISIYIGSQDNEQFLKDVAGKCWPLNIVIDDGSHMMTHQQESFRVLFPLLASGGIYVIEDIHTCYHPEFMGQAKQTTLIYIYNIIHDLNKHGYNYGNKQRSVPANYYEDNIKAIHFHKSMVIIEKI